MMEENRPPRLRFRLGTLLLVVAVLALLLVVVIQQIQIGRQEVQIGRQQGQIKQLMLRIDKCINQNEVLSATVQEQRFLRERHK